MPFSSQPRKKGAPGSQDGIKKSSCGHSASQGKSCPACQKTASAEKKVIDLPTEKKKLAALHEKIKTKLLSESKSLEKAAFVLSNWLNKKSK